MPTAALSTQIRKARNRSTPLLGVETTDPAETIASVLEALKPKNGDKDEPPCWRWDCHSGSSALNEAGTKLLSKLLQSDKYSEDVTTGEEGLVRLLGFASDASLVKYRFVLVLVNPQRFLSNPEVLQGIWNLRDTLKAHQSTLVCIGASLQFPAELSGDIMLFDDPLPDRDRLQKIAEQCLKDAKQSADDNTLSRVVDAVAGLSAFQAEQVTAMSIEKEGVSVDYAWQRKMKQVEQTPGLAFDRAKDTLDDLGGLDSVKEFAKSLFAGNDAPALVARIEEVEKVLAGSQGDTSGVSQDLLQVLLNAFEDNGWTGVILFGPPGTAKSATAKALGQTFGVPSVLVDLNACKGSLVGESEAKVRQAVRVLKAIGGSKILFVATANKLDVLPAELKRRFRLSTWFFDMPTAEELKAIWKIQLAKHGLPPKSKLPDDTGWTGADVRNCSEVAYRLKQSPHEAARYIVPTSMYASEAITACRRLANGRFLSASHEGVYREHTEPQTITTKLKPGRRMTVDQD